MPAFAYARGLGSADACTEATALLKVARHAPCCHGWRLEPDPASPYGRMPPAAVPGAAPCACPGAQPPADLTLSVGTAQPASVPELTSSWPICGRCRHPLLTHGELLLDPHEERVRRTRVAVRLDELLEVRVPRSCRTTANSSTLPIRMPTSRRFSGTTHTDADRSTRSHTYGSRRPLPRRTRRGPTSPQRACQGARTLRRHRTPRPQPHPALRARARRLARPIPARPS